MSRQPRHAPSPADAAAGALIGKLLDEVIDRYASGRHVAEVVAAREAWLEQAGRVYDDEPSYDARMAAFHEWFVLHRPDAGGAVPAERFLGEEGKRLGPAAAACLRALCRAQWSLFEVVDAADATLALCDRWGGGSYEVTLERDLPGLERGDLFEARVVGVDASVRFTRAFLFHVREAAEAIGRHIQVARRRGDAKETVLFRLAAVRLRCDRYHNIAPLKIYRQTLARDERAGGR